MDCYARLEIPIKIGDAESRGTPTPAEEPLDIPDFSSLVGVGINFDCPASDTEKVYQWLEYNSDPERYAFLWFQTMWLIQGKGRPAQYSMEANEENYLEIWPALANWDYESANERTVEEMLAAFYRLGLDWDDYDRFYQVPIFNETEIIAPSPEEQLEILFAWYNLGVYLKDKRTTPHPDIAKYGLDSLMSLEGKDNEIAQLCANFFMSSRMLQREFRDEPMQPAAFAIQYSYPGGLRYVTEAKRLLGLSGSSGGFLADNPVPASDWVELAPVDGNLANGTVTLSTHEGDLGVGMNWELRQNGDFNVNGSSMGASFGDPANVTWPGWLDSWRNQKLPANIVLWDSSSNYSECNTSWSGF